MNKKMLDRTMQQEKYSTCTGLSSSAAAAGGRYYYLTEYPFPEELQSKYTTATMEETVILVAVDDTPHSRKALRWALENLSACRSSNSRLVLVHAEPVGQVYAVPGDGLLAGYYVSPDMISAIRQHEETVTASVFQEAKKICEEYGVSPKTVVSLGDARDGICDAAEKENADILVMGSHGYGALKRAFLGSVSDYCVHHVKCPVVVVKPDHS